MRRAEAFRRGDFRLTAQIAAYTSITAGAWRWEISRLRFASLEMTGRGRSRRSAIGCWLPACLRQPPSPLRGPLPPDKQWGAREYIGARHIAPFGGRSNGVRTLVQNVHSPLKWLRGCRPLSESRHNLRRQAAMSLARKKRPPQRSFFHISIPGPVPPGSGRCPGYRSGWRRL